MNDNGTFFGNPRGIVRPGLGALLIQSIQNSDIPVVMGATFIFSVLVVLFNIVADLLYGVLDPRIRYS